MTGGQVVGLARHRARATLLNVEDPRTRQCEAIRVWERRCEGGGGVEIKVGDSVWWESGYVLWTPAEPPAKPLDAQVSGCDFDIRLRRAGSGE